MIVKFKGEGVRGIKVGEGILFFVDGKIDVPEDVAKEIVKNSNEYEIVKSKPKSEPKKKISRKKKE